MAATSTQLLPLLAPAPDFALPDTTSGRTVRRADYDGRPLLVMFLCNHCPYVKHLNRGLVELAREYQAKGLAVVAISSNDVTAYPEDGPDEMRRRAAELEYPFPYLFDETQAVARAYRAACTPDFFLFDAEGRLAYRGQFDESRPGKDVPVTGRDLRAATDAVLAGAPAPAPQRPSIGCSIKWRAGGAPGYAA
jgi:peroxiredoxin